MPCAVARENLWIQVVTRSVVLWLAAVQVGIMIVLVVVYYSSFASPLFFLLRAAYLQLTIVLLISSTFLLLIARGHHPLQALIALLAFLLLLPIVSQFGDGKKQGNNIDTIRVLSFSGMTRSKNEHDLTTLLSEEKPDIACLQEFPPTDGLQAAIRGYNSSHQGQSALTVLSRAPVAAYRNSGRVLEARTNLKDMEEVNVINVHMPRQYRNVDRDAWQEVENLVESNEKAVLCGDFNMTPYNLGYRRLVEKLGLVDAHKRAGEGFGLTFPHANRRIALFGPLLRLDYVFVKGFEVVSARTIEGSALSDHRAVVVDLIPSNAGDSH